MEAPLLEDTAVQSEENSVHNVQQQNQNLPEEEPEGEEYRQRIEELRGRGEPINIVVIGYTGTGKSTLINNMMGKTVAKVSSRIISEQFQVEEHEGEHKGIRIKVYDTVGFGDSRGKSNLDILHEINAKGKFDLVLLCIDMTSRAHGILKEILSDVKLNLHVELWKHMVVVLTRTNVFVLTDPLIKDKPVAEKEKDVENKIQDFKKYVRSQVTDCVKMDTFDKIPFCIAGDKVDKPLLEENWLNPLWVSCIDQCSEESYHFLKDFVEVNLGRANFRTYYARLSVRKNPRGGQENRCTLM